MKNEMGHVPKEKRRGSHGKRPAELGEEIFSVVSSPESRDSTEAAGSSRPISDGPRPKPTNETKPSRLREMENVSANKLANSKSNEEMENSILTRTRAKSLGIADLPKEENGHGLKIQDFSLLGVAFFLLKFAKFARRATLS